MRKIMLIPLSSLILSVSIILEIVSIFSPWMFIKRNGLIFVFSPIIDIKSPLSIIIVYSFIIDILYFMLLVKNAYYRKSLYILKTSIVLGFITFFVLFLLNYKTIFSLEIGIFYFSAALGLKIFGYEISNLGMIIIELSSESSIIAAYE